MASAIQNSLYGNTLSDVSGIGSQDILTITGNSAGPFSSDTVTIQSSGERVDLSNLLDGIQTYTVNDGSGYVNAASPLESLSGLEFVGQFFGDSAFSPARNQAINAAIQSGEVRNYQGSSSQVGGDWAHLNPVGNALGSTLGAAGLAAGAAIAEVPVIGNYDFLGISILSPFLNTVFGQAELSPDMINRNAVYNFGPRATAFENLGTAYGTGVADGLRGTTPFAPAEQKVAGWDDAMGAINNALRGIASFNLPVISTGADFLRGLARAAKGDEMFDIINTSSKDPMDPSWTAFSAPIGVLTSAFFRAAAPALGLNQQAMDARYGRAVGDMMNVYDIFLPGDHTRHGFGSFFPRLIFGAPNVNMLHGHVHQFDAVGYAAKLGSPVSQSAMSHDMAGMSHDMAGMPSDLAGLLAGSGIPGIDTTDTVSVSDTISTMGGFDTVSVSDTTTTSAHDMMNM